MALEAGTLYVTLGLDITQFEAGLEAGAARLTAFTQSAQTAVSQATAGLQAAASTMTQAGTAGQAAGESIAAGTTVAKTALDKLTAQVDQMEASLKTVAGTEIAPKLDDAALKQALTEVDTVRTQLTELSKVPVALQVKADTAAAKAAVQTLQGDLRGLLEVPPIQVKANTAPAENSFTRLRDSITGLEAKITGLTSGIGGMITKMAGIGFAVAGLQQIVQVAAMAGEALGVNFNAKLENLTTAFSGLLGSAKAAGDYLQELQTFAASTPFSFDSVVTAAQRFMGMGLAAQQVIPVLTDIGNAMAKVGGGSVELERVEVAYSQIVAKGKVSAQEMNQMAENNVAAWKMLADYTHQSIASVMADAERGKISADTFMKAFHAANVGDAMSAQAKTFTGAMSTIVDSVQMATGKAFKPLFDELSKGAQSVAQFLSSAQFQQWAQGAASAVAGLLQVLGGTLNAFGTLGVWIVSHEPVLYGLVAAVGAYSAQMALATAVTIAHKIELLATGFAIMAYQAGIVATIPTTAGATAATLAWAAAVGVLDIALAPLTLTIAAIALAAGGLKLAWDNNALGLHDATNGMDSFIRSTDKAVPALGALDKAVLDLQNNIRTAMAGGAEKVAQDQKAAYTKLEAMADDHEKAVLGVINSQGDVAQRLYQEQAAQMLATWQEAEARRLTTLRASGDAQKQAVQHMSADWDDSARHVSAFAGTFDDAMKLAQQSMERHLQEQVEYTKQQVIQISQNMAIDPAPYLQAYEKAKTDYQNFLDQMEAHSETGGHNTAQAFVTHWANTFSSNMPEFDKYVKMAAATLDQKELFGLMGAQDAAAYTVNLLMGVHNALAAAASDMEDVHSGAAEKAKQRADQALNTALSYGRQMGVISETIGQKQKEMADAAEKAAEREANAAKRKADALAKHEQAVANHAAAVAKHLSQEQVDTAEILGRIVTDSDGKSQKWQQVIQAMVEGAQKATEAHLPAIAAVFTKTLQQMDSATPPTMEKIHATFTQALQRMSTDGPAYMRAIAQGVLSQLDALHSQAAAKEHEAAQKLQKEFADSFEAVARQVAELGAKMAAARVAVTDRLGDIAAAVSAKGATIQSQFKALWELAQQATQAGMHDLASTITNWLQAAANGTAPPMGQIRDTIISRLKEAAAGGDLQLRLLAQAALQHLSEMEQSAAAEAQKTEEEVGKHLHQLYEDAVKAAEATKAATHSAMESLLQGLASAGQAAVDKGKSVTDLLVQLMPLLKQAVDAGMPGVAQTIQQWMEAARTGTGVSAQAIYQQILQWLQAAQQGGDAALALLAQQGVEHMQQLSQAVNPALQAAQSQLQSLNAGLQQDQAALQNWGNVVKNAQGVVQGLQSDLQKAQNDLQNFTNAQLQGTQAFSDASFGNQQQQNALQLAINQLQLNGNTPEARHALEAQLAQLKAANKIHEDQLAAQIAGMSAGPERDALKHQLEQLRANDRLAEQSIQNSLTGLDTGPAATQIQNLQDQLHRLQLEGQNIHLEESLQLDPLRRQLEQIQNPVHELTFQEARDGALAARDRIQHLNEQLGRAQGHLAAVQAAQAKMQAAVEQDNAAIAAQQALIQHLQEGTQTATAGMTAMTTSAAAFGTTLADVSANALAPLVANFNQGLADLPPAFDAVFGPGPGTIGYKITGHDPDSFLPKLDTATRLQFGLYVGQGGPWVAGLNILQTNFSNKLTELESTSRPQMQGVGQSIAQALAEGIQSQVASIAAAAAATVRSAIEAAQAAAGGGTTGAASGQASAVHGPAHGAGRAPVGVGTGSIGSAGGPQTVQLVGPIIVQDIDGSQRTLRVLNGKLEYQIRAGSLA